MELVFEGYVAHSHTHIHIHTHIYTYLNIYYYLTFIACHLKHSLVSSINLAFIWDPYLTKNC